MRAGEKQFVPSSVKLRVVYLYRASKIALLCKIKLRYFMTLDRVGFLLENNQVLYYNAKLETLYI